MGTRTEFRQEACTCKEVVHTKRFHLGVEEYRIASLKVRSDNRDTEGIIVKPAKVDQFTQALTRGGQIVQAVEA